MDLEGAISRIIPRRGRGPGVVVITSGDEVFELTTFDPDVLRTAAGNINAECKATYTEKPSADGLKTYKNLVGLVVAGSVDAQEGSGDEISSEALSPYQAETKSLAKANSATPYVLFDRADDEMIIAKLRGEVAKNLVYCFKQQGQMIYGLGIDGAEACKRELAKHGEVIEEESVEVVKEDNYQVLVEARASRWAVNADTGTRLKLDTVIGVKRQEKMMGSGARNPFWWEQAASKAMRNAILRLVPEEIKVRVIENYKQYAKEVEEK